MSEYKICEVCGIKYFVDPRKKRGRKKQLPVCSDHCRSLYISRTASGLPVNNEEAKPEKWKRGANRKPHKKPQGPAPKRTKEGNLVFNSKDFRCDRKDCIYRSNSTNTYGGCDYILITGHARSLICTVEDCTEYKPGKRQPVQPM